MNFIIAIALIILSIFFLHKQKKWLTFALLVGSLCVSALKYMPWHFELDSLVSVGLLLAIISLIVVSVCSNKNDKVNRQIELLVIAVLLWISLFIGTKSVNQFYDTSNEQIVTTKVNDITELGKERGESILWYFGYNRNTQLDFAVFGKEYSIDVPTHSCDKLSVGDSIILGVKDGLFGIKHCYIVFDEQNNVAEELPETRTEGKYILTNSYSD
ncbi:MAG: hypothetical protein IJZ57_04550 [Clostridia bacterium]|nr:hypothetical protein [Clostridia bacterium]